MKAAITWVLGCAAAIAACGGGADGPDNAASLSAGFIADASAAPPGASAPASAPASASASAPAGEPSSTIAAAGSAIAPVADPAAGRSGALVQDSLRFDLIDVGGLPGFARSRGVAINAFGQLLGQSVGDDESRAFVHAEGRLIDVGIADGMPWIHPQAISRSGVVVGAASPGGEAAPTRAFTAVPERDGYHFTWLPLVPGSRESFASGVSNDGKVVGYSFLQAGERPQRAYLHVDGSVEHLGDTPVGPAAHAMAISPDGTRIGVSAVESGTGGRQMLFTRSDDGYTPLSDSDNGSIHAISDAGVAVGCRSQFRDIRAVYWVNGQSFEIPKVVPQGKGDIGCAFAVNAAGLIVGYESHRYFGSELPPDAPKAFLYGAGRSIAIEDLLQPAHAGWRIVEARGIDDEGRIAATGRFDGGADRAVLLLPAAPTQTR